MTVHLLKILPEFFEPLRLGHKPFEVRRDDRGYVVGDLLNLREWTPEHGFSGRGASAWVTYVLPGGQFGIEPGFVVLGLRG